MRVRVIRTMRGVFTQNDWGKVLELDDAKAIELLNLGLVMEDKSIDIPEVKAHVTSDKNFNSTSYSPSNSIGGENTRTNR